MNDATRKTLLVSSEILKLVLPVVAPGVVSDVAARLIDSGMSWADARQALADNNATPEQLKYLDQQNEVSVLDKIREMGKPI